MGPESARFESLQEQMSVLSSAPSSIDAWPLLLQLYRGIFKLHTELEEYSFFLGRERQADYLPNSEDPNCLCKFAVFGTCDSLITVKDKAQPKYCTLQMLSAHKALHPFPKH